VETGPVSSNPTNSSSWGLVLFTALAVASSAAAAVVTVASIVGTDTAPPDPRLILSVVLFDLLIILALAWSIRKLIADVRRARLEHQSAAEVVAERARTVDRLLEFSQTIQGAGRPEQIFTSLAHFLSTDLKLSGVAIIAHDPESVPALHVKAAWPDDLLRQDQPVADVDAAMCPCLRQNLPRQYAPGSPVRCAIDACLRLDANHPAYCIPFTIGRSARCVVHMLLSPARQWTEPLRHLAQTYINAAYSSLISLHLLTEAEKQSLTDSLTGLYNRRSLDQLLSREMALAERHGHPLSLVMIDLDNFKQVNDLHGHAAGDHLLRSFADCVRITLRKTDMAFRYGGDEFVIALPQTPLMQAQSVVQKLRQAFSAVDFSGAIAGLAVQPTLSIGVAERCKEAGIVTVEQLLAAADAAVYEAKNSNRNCVRVFSTFRAA
jgi:diguanylate cyclase (GGDEF)-like protein